MEGKKQKKVRSLIPENEVKNELNIKVVFETLKRIPQYSECAKIYMLTINTFLNMSIFQKVVLEML